MIFTWDYTDICVVFRWWQITNLASLLLSLAAIVFLSMGYEYLRECTRRFEKKRVLVDGTYVPISTIYFPTPSNHPPPPLIAQIDTHIPVCLFISL